MKTKKNKSYKKALDLVNKHYDDVESYLEQWRTDDGYEQDEGGTEYFTDFNLCLDDGSAEGLLYNVLFIVSAGATEGGHDEGSRLFNRIAETCSFDAEKALHAVVVKNIINLDDVVQYDDGRVLFAAIGRF